MFHNLRNVEINAAFLFRLRLHRSDIAFLRLDVLVEYSRGGVSLLKAITQFRSPFKQYLTL